MNNPITAIHSGGDWFDASAEYLVLADGISMKNEHKAYRDWYQKQYLPSIPDASVPYVTLYEFCLLRGARPATDGELVIYDAC